MISKFRFIFLLLAFTGVTGLYAQTYSHMIPAQEGSVNDFEELFTPAQRTELASMLDAFTLKTNKEIAVVTLKSISPFPDIHMYSLGLAAQWSIAKDTDAGLLIIISKTLGKVKISTAYGTASLIQNDVCKNAINNIMIPKFTSGDYFNGTKEGVISLMKEWK